MLHLSKEETRYTAWGVAVSITIADLLHAESICIKLLVIQEKKKLCYKMHCKCMLTVLGGEEAS